MRLVVSPLSIYILLYGEIATTIASQIISACSHDSTDRVIERWNFVRNTIRKEKIKFTLLFPNLSCYGLSSVYYVIFPTQDMFSSLYYLNT